MRLRRIVTTIAVALVVTGIVANTASAGVTTYASQWYVSGGTLNEEVAVKGKLNSKFLIRAFIDGEPVNLTATGFDCVSCVITNTAVTENTAKTATAKGRFKLTGVTVNLPTGCKVRNKNRTGTVGVLETWPLVMHFDWMNGVNFYAQFTPETGTALAAAYLEGGGCEPTEGSYNMTGTLFGRATGETGVEAAEVGYEFSPFTQAEVGALKFGSSTAELEGSAALELESGKKFELR